MESIDVICLDYTINHSLCPKKSLSILVMEFKKYFVHMDSNIKSYVEEIKGTSKEQAIFYQT
jgi:hypothetical protein